MKLFTLDNITKILGIIFMVTGGVYVLYAVLGMSDNYYYENQIFSFVYGVFSIAAGYGLFTRTSWAVYGFVMMLVLELLGEYLYTKSGVGVNDIFFFFAGLAAAYYLFVKK